MESHEDMVEGRLGDEGGESKVKKNKKIDFLFFILVLWENRFLIFMCVCVCV